MKVKFFVYCQNCGDGSATARFFSSLEVADEFAEKDEEGFCESIHAVELEFDDQGNLLTPSPIHWKDN